MSDPRRLESPGAALMERWRRWSARPGGRALFSWILGRMVPYSGSLGARIHRLEPGVARATVRDRRHLRNHLGSIHAVALTNLGELVSGLAVLTALPPGVRGIVVRLETAYHHKARGALGAECAWSPPEPLELPGEARARAAITDAEGRTVAEVTATWRLDR